MRSYLCGCRDAMSTSHLCAEITFAVYSGALLKYFTKNVVFQLSFERKLCLPVLCVYLNALLWPPTVICFGACNPSSKFGQSMTQRLWELLFISAEKRSCKASVCKLHRAATLGPPLWAAHPCVISVGCLISLGPVHLEVIAVLSRWISMFLLHSPVPMKLRGKFSYSFFLLWY